MTYEKSCTTPGLCDLKVAIEFGSRCNKARNESEYCRQCKDPNCNEKEGADIAVVGESTPKAEVEDTDPPVDTESPKTEEDGYIYFIVIQLWRSTFDARTTKNRHQLDTTIRST